MRAHRQVPGHRQQQQLGEHRQPAPPALADHQRASGGQHRAAEQQEPERGAQPVDHPLVGSGDRSHHQHRGHHQRGQTLRRDDESRATNGGRGRWYLLVTGAAVHSVSVATPASSPCERQFPHSAALSVPHKLVRHASRADREPHSNFHHTGRPRSAGACPQEPPRAHRRAHQPPRSRHRTRPRGRRGRSGPGRRARRRRHGERGRQRPAGPSRCDARRGMSPRSRWCPAVRRMCWRGRWESPGIRSPPPTSSSS